jgi:hypothetical protein
MKGAQIHVAVRQNGAEAYVWWESPTSLVLKSEWGKWMRIRVRKQ